MNSFRKQHISKKHVLKIFHKNRLYVSEQLRFLDTSVAILRSVFFLSLLCTGTNLTCLHSPLLHQCFKVVQNNELKV